MVEYILKRKKTNARRDGSHSATATVSISENSVNIIRTKASIAFEMQSYVTLRLYAEVEMQKLLIYNCFNLST